MYVHIGNNNIIDSKNIVGIFNLETLKNSKEFCELFNKLQESKNIIDISQGKSKSFILIIEEEITKAYISNISSITLESRIYKLDNK